MPHPLPKGKSLPRADEQPLQRCNCQAQVEDFVALVHHVKTGARVIQGAVLFTEKMGQRLPLLAGGIAAAIPPHGGIKEQAALPLAQGQQPREQLGDAFAGHKRLLSAGILPAGTVSSIAGRKKSRSGKILGVFLRKKEGSPLLWNSVAHKGTKEMTGHSQGDYSSVTLVRAASCWRLRGAGRNFRFCPMNGHSMVAARGKARYNSHRKRSVCLYLAAAAGKMAGQTPKRVGFTGGVSR